MHVTRKWTQEIRTSLYEQLVSHFGPYVDWEKFEIPNAGARKYERFLREFSKYCLKRFGVRFGRKDTNGVRAIKQQIAYAITQQKLVSGARISLWVLNKAAAQEAGFISYRELPSLMSLGIKRRKQ